MISPLQNPLDPLDPGADRLPPSGTPNRQHEQAAAEQRSDEAAGDRDLQRLESSLEWLKRECVIIRLESGLRAQKQGRRLPRAAQLPPAPGIAPVSPEGSGHKPAPLTFHLAPPLASERLQPRPPRRHHLNNVRGALAILIASVIAGSTAYYISAGTLPAAELAQAASLQAPWWQPAPAATRASPRLRHFPQ